MSNQFTSNSREEVLETIRATPNITASMVKKEVGLSSGRVFNILADLSAEGLVQWRIVPPEPGVSRTPRRVYFIEEPRASRIPAAWDVLAHFFGRIAEPVAA